MLSTSAQNGSGFATLASEKVLVYREGLGDVTDTDCATTSEPGKMADANGPRPHAISASEYSLK